MKPTLLAAVIAMVAAGSASANDYLPAMQEFLNDNVRGWASNQVLVDAILAQNATTGGYDQASIDAMDLEWRAQVGQSNAPLVTQVLENPAADFLRGQVASSGGIITEVFIMDARGLNVAASGATSDMWQGDEEKFSETFPKGPDAAHFSEVELDESTQTYQGQISVPIVDPASGNVIGAITVGVNAEALL